MPICKAFMHIEQQPNICDAVHVKYFDKIIITLCEDLSVLGNQYFIAYKCNGSGNTGNKLPLFPVSRKWIN